MRGVGRLGAALVAAPLLAAAATPPESVGRWYISVDDYPSQALRDGATGVTRYEIAVDVQGKPVACTVRKSSGHEVLDQQTCALVMKRARFKPALDYGGNPVAGVWRRQVIWNPVPTPPRPGYAGYGVTVSFDDNGEVSACKVVSLSAISKVTPEQADKCRSLGTAAVFAELLGRSTAGLTKATFRMRLENTVLGGALRSDEPVQRVLAHVEFDRTKEGAISWCDVKVAPVTPLLDIGQTDLCGLKAFGVTSDKGGGLPVQFIQDVVATR